MKKDTVKYKLIGYRPCGVNYNIPRTEIAEFKNGEWYPYGKGKAICNMVIEKTIKLK